MYLLASEMHFEVYFEKRIYVEINVLDFKNTFHLTFLVTIFIYLKHILVRFVTHITCMGVFTLQNEINP